MPAPTLLNPETHAFDTYALGDPQQRYDIYYSRGSHRLCVVCSHWFPTNDTEPWAICAPCESMPLTQRQRRERS